MANLHAVRQETLKPNNKIELHGRNRGQMTINDKLLNYLKEKADNNVQRIHEITGGRQQRVKKHIFMHTIGSVVRLIPC